MRLHYTAQTFWQANFVTIIFDQDFANRTHAKKYESTYFAVANNILRLFNLITIVIFLVHFHHTFTDKYLYLTHIFPLKDKFKSIYFKDGSEFEFLK